MKDFRLDFRKYRKKVGCMFAYERIYWFWGKLPTFWVKIRFRDVEKEENV